MTTTINASTSSGLVNTADTSGILQLQTASTAALTIDASQNVGIGTASPVTPVTVATTGNFSGNGVRVVAKSAPTGYFTEVKIQNDGTVGSVVDAGGSSNNYLSLQVQSTEKMRVLSTGNILCLLGGNTSATGTGIAFPATQSASSDANTLDDYEEGTWTPTYTATSGSFGAITYRFQNGKYTKIGNAVSFTCQIATDSITVSTATGSVTISGLPFSSNASENAYAVSTANTFGANYPSGANTPLSGNTIRLLYRTTANGVTAGLPVTSLDTTSAYGNLVQIAGTYFV